MRAQRFMAAAALSLLASPVTAQMAHPPGMSHAQVAAAASAGGPSFVSDAATIAWIDSAANLHVMRQGTNGFTCVIAVPDPFAGPICGDQNAAAWLLAMLRGAPQPPAMTSPGIAYMARGGSHYEDPQGNVVMEHDRSPHAATSRRVTEGPHWMLIWPFDPATSGLPTRENASGVYIMFAGTPWAHLMVYQDPNQLRTPPRR